MRQRVAPDTSAAPLPGARSAGKFIAVGGEKRYIRGVTYGTFSADERGIPLPFPETVARDFAAMVASGVNAVRVYTAPPRWFLDLALEHGLFVMVGLAWEQHVAFLDDRKLSAGIVERMRKDVASCVGHPAILCYAIGNEIPASIVRWHGRRGVERFLKRLCRAVKTVDPEALVTYVNYPSTEYLQLPFIDIVSFNVFLESPDQLDAYVGRLQNIAGNRPLMITELGLDSRRSSEDEQARSVESQVRTSFAAGCAGAFVFSWTDEWHRGGAEIDDWDFGLVDRNRRPKPALAALSRAFAELPFPSDVPYPPVSVIVCSRNGEATIGACLEGLRQLDYPDYEVIVVDDGSSDTTAEIARSSGARLISTENRGLSSARNTGLEAAAGEIVAFLDDDACPDRDWLKFLAATFLSTEHTGVGGPNIPPPGAGLVEIAVGRAPGGPIHVLLSDREAEHIPGCNMAFRRKALQAAGGFDAQFRVAGDDVDLCWRLQQEGRTLGFNPAAMVWHKRRGSIRAYLKQQREYGKAEALLERKWPQKYNRGGHVDWAGQVYGDSRSGLGRRWRIYYGTWGSSLFQSLYERAPSTSGPLPLTPEWYLAIGALTVLSVPGLFPRSPLYSLPALTLLGASVAALAVWATRAAWNASPAPRGATARELTLRCLTGLLFLLQPLARLSGRTRHGLTPWRRRGEFRFALPWPRTRLSWSEQWQAQHARLLDLEARLRPRCMTVLRGGDHDRWDVHVRLGSFGAARLRVAVEEHGHGRQLVRFRIWPRLSRAVPVILALLGVFLAIALRRDFVSAEVAGLAMALVALRAARECAAGVALLLDAIEPAVPAAASTVKAGPDGLVSAPRAALPIERCTAAANGRAASLTLAGEDGSDERTLRSAHSGRPDPGE